MSNLDHALMYADLAWKIFPVHSIDEDGNCTCGPTPRCVQDDTAAKHPRNGGNGHLEATDDRAQIERWWTAYPDANIGLYLAGSGLVAVDVDPRNGGDRSLADLESLIDLGETYWHTTGGGGKHLIYQNKSDVTYKGKIKNLPGLDIKHQGYVLLPPSLHKSGMRYERGSVGVRPAPLSEAFAELIVKKRGARQTPDDSDFVGVEDVFAGVGSGSRDDQAFRYACSMRARGIKMPEAKALMTMAWQAMEQNGHEFSLSTALEKVDRAYNTYDEGRNGLPADDAERNTDRVNGEDLARLVQDRLLWTEGLDWLIWDGKRWAPDETLRREAFVVDLADELWRRVPEAGADRDVVIKRAKKLETAAGLAGALKFAKPLLARKTIDFDQHPWEFNCQNGTLNTQTGELRPQDPADLITRVSPVAYVKGAQDKILIEFLRSALPNPAHYEAYHVYIGSCLADEDGDKSFLVPHGPTNTGKSTAVEPLMEVFGDVDAGGYASTWEAGTVQTLSNINRGEKLAKVRAARLVIIGELTKGSRFDDPFMKRITGGDWVDSKALYKGSMSFRPKFHVIMHSNYVPKSADPALLGRLKVLPFNNVFSGDKSVKQYLETNPRALEAYLAWAVEGCLKWRKDGLPKMEWSDEFTAKLLGKSSPVVAFVDEYLERVDIDDRAQGEWIEVMTCWSLYRKWCAIGEERGLKKRDFDDAIEDLGYEKVRPHVDGKRPTVWRGLKSQHPDQGL